MKKLALFILLFIPLALRAQVPVNLAPAPYLQFLDATATPLAGGCVFFYQAGTSTPQATYADSAGTILNPNPIVLDGGGFAPPIWLVAADTYDVAVWSNGGTNCSAGSQIRKALNVNNGIALLSAPNIFTALNTFAAGITGTGNTGTLSAGIGILNVVNTWGANQIFTTLTSVSANPSISGSLRLANTDSVAWRNAANSGDILLNPLAASGNIPADYLTSTHGFAAGAFISNTANVPADTGAVRLNSGDGLCWRNPGNTADVCLTQSGGNVIVPGSTVSLICTVTTPVTVANTTSQTPLQTCTVPANSINMGTTFLLMMTGRVSATGTPNLALILDLDSTPLSDYSFSLAAGTIQPWSAEISITGLSTGPSGSITMGSGNYSSSSIGGGVVGTAGTQPATITLDTTISHTLSFTAIWGTASASNTVTQYTFLVYKIG